MQTAEELKVRVVENTMPPFTIAMNTLLAVLASACILGMLYSVGTQPGVWEGDVGLGALGTACSLVLVGVLVANQLGSVSFSDKDKWLPMAVRTVSAMACVLSLAVVGAIGRGSTTACVFSFLALCLGMALYAASTPWWVLGDYSYTRAAWSFSGLTVGVAAAACAMFIPLESQSARPRLTLGLLAAGFSMYTTFQIIPTGYTHVKSNVSASVSTMAPEEEVV